MDQKNYDAIMMKIDIDRNNVYQELSLLQKKRQQHYENIEREKKKVNDNTKVLSSGRINSSLLMNGISFNPERIKKENKQIQIINGYIQKQNEELEKINEKERLIKEMYRENLKEKAKRARKVEEEAIIELKVLDEASNKGGE